MIKHIVLFKLKSFENPLEKEQLMNDFKVAIEALNGRIEGIVSLEVGINCNENEDFDIALVSAFTSMEALQHYSTHPEHVAAASLLKDAKDSRSCVDYYVADEH